MCTKYCHIQISHSVARKLESAKKEAFWEKNPEASLWEGSTCVQLRGSRVKKFEGPRGSSMRLPRSNHILRVSPIIAHESVMAGRSIRRRNTGIRSGSVASGTAS